MAKIDITRTELVWPSKYNEDGTRREVERVNLPFQIIETINESRATREAKKEQQPSLLDVWEGKEGDTFEEGWRNKLIWGDNLPVMSSLLAKFAGKVNLIYIDPPFATGADFNFTTQIGEDNLEAEKEQSIIEEKAYRDTWGRGPDSYLQMISERLVLMRDLLADDGSIYVHLDWHVGHYVKLVMDEVFNRDNFQNEIVWVYRGRELSRERWNRKHDTIYFYGVSPSFHFDPSQVLDPYDPATMQHFKHTDEHGRRYRVRPRDGTSAVSGGAESYKQYLGDGSLPRDWFEVDFVTGGGLGGSSENLGFSTQKPSKVVERLVKASSNEGDLVADFFCGSGTTLAVAEKLGRRWIGCDLSRWAIHTSRKRLLGIEGCKPFELLNLGKYERRYWQTVTFGRGREKTDQQVAIFEYLAFMLKLYGAEPLTGMEHLHGKKGKAMVHVGAVDAPVTIDEINACLDESLAIGQKELHVLGWEWEMGLYDLITEAAKRRGIKLLLLNIPREVMEKQAVDKGDIRFFELAFLDAEVQVGRNRTAALTLKDFVIPNTDLIPEEVRDKVKKWSDYIDYWAVDWDFQNDTFMNGWVAYRTKKDRSLPLQSGPHHYDRPGTHTVMVKVIDVFGNDTSQAFEVEVK